MKKESPPNELVERIARGDRDAESQLVERYSAGLWAFFGARWHAHGAVAIEDLVQDTLQLVLEALRNGRLKDPNKITSWIIGVARNVANNARRKEGHRDHDALRENDLIDVSPPRWMAEHSRFTSATVHSVLNKLRRKHREILVAYYVDELERDQICQLYELTPAELSRLLYRAKAALRKKLERVLPKGLDT